MEFEKLGLGKANCNDRYLRANCHFPARLRHEHACGLGLVRVGSVGVSDEMCVRMGTETVQCTTTSIWLIWPGMLYKRLCFTAC